MSAITLGAVLESLLASRELFGHAPEPLLMAVWGVTLFAAAVAARSRAHKPLSRAS